MKHAKHVKGKLTPSEVSAQSKSRHIKSKNSVGVTVSALVLLLLSVAALVFWWLSSKRWMLFVSMLVFGACLFGVGLFTKSYNKRLGVVICTLALLAGIFGMLDAALPAQERQLEYSLLVLCLCNFLVFYVHLITLLYLCVVYCYFS